MNLEEAFGEALRRSRQAQGISQEEFSPLSGRTYVSVLERGKKSPTLNKIDQFSSILKIHPLTLLTYCYMLKEENQDIDSILSTIKNEVNNLAITAKQ